MFRMQGFVVEVGSSLVSSDGQHSVVHVLDSGPTWCLFFLCVFTFLIYLPISYF